MSAEIAATNYNTLAHETNHFQKLCSENEDNDETPGSSGVMIHVVPETNKARWNHIDDLDSFFTKMYCYHQKHGFAVIALDSVLELVQFAFVVGIVTYFVHCVRYPLLFGDFPAHENTTKVTIPDVVVPSGECVRSFGTMTWIAVITTSLILFFRLVRVSYHVAQFWDIKKFFNSALKIEDDELDNLTWHEVQKKVREVQSEQQMCIHKEQLTELDIYHRILRFKNYTVAMINKNLVPTRMKLPIIGEIGCLSRSLKFNIELALFRCPWSPFENSWHLREDFKKVNKRQELARKLSNQIMLLAMVNLVLSPLIFFWQVTYISFSYATLLRREPGVLGTRCWSLFGRLYLRHFNELDHELDTRLSRAYKPADRYISSFSSPIMAVIARNILFLCGGVLAIIILLTIYNEHVMQVEHVLTIASVLTIIGVGVRVFIPNENMIWCPEQLLTTVLAHVHYLPTSWRGLAHTEKVRASFEQFFQLKATYLLTELFSPFITPFILMYSFRPKALDIVDFFRNFTVSVVGVGDVCSFAQMDVRKHGNPEWQITKSLDTNEINGNGYNCVANQYTQGENGKTELSLIHFTLTNPEWKMPMQAKYFLQCIQKHALEELNKMKVSAANAPIETVMEQSLLSFGNLGNEYSSIAQSLLENRCATSLAPHQFTQRRANTTGDSTTAYETNYHPGFEQMLQQNLYDPSIGATTSVLHNIEEKDYEGDLENTINSQNALKLKFSGRHAMEKSVRRGVSRVEGKIEGSTEGLLYSLYGHHPRLTADSSTITTAEMCFSALHLHEIHHKKRQERGISLEQSHKQLWQQPRAASSLTSCIETTKAAEYTPLLGSKRS